MQDLILFAAFTLIGSVMGFITIFMFRISIHQKKFGWKGALAAVTTLGGGGFLSYLSKPMHFGLYAIGYSTGTGLYIIYLILRSLPRSNKISLPRMFRLSTLSYDDRSQKKDNKLNDSPKP